MAVPATRRPDVDWYSAVNWIKAEARSPPAKKRTSRKAAQNTIPGAPIYRYDYTFTGEQSPYTWRFLLDSTQLAARVLTSPSRMPARNPSLSRIHGMERTPVGPFGLMTIIFPLVGRAFIIPRPDTRTESKSPPRQRKSRLRHLQVEKATKTRVNNPPSTKSPSIHHRHRGDLPSHREDLPDGTTRGQSATRDRLRSADPFLRHPGRLPAGCTAESTTAAWIQPARFGSVLLVTILPGPCHHRQYRLPLSQTRAVGPLQFSCHYCRRQRRRLDHAALGKSAIGFIESADDLGNATSCGRRLVEPYHSTTLVLWPSYPPE